MSKFHIKSFRIRELYWLFLGAYLTSVAFLKVNLIAGCVVGYLVLVLMAAILCGKNQGLFSWTSSHTVKRTMVLLGPLTIALNVIVYVDELIVWVIYAPRTKFLAALRDGRKLWIALGLTYYSLWIIVAIFVVYILIS